jgi:predicted NBD/HSP70 family sugar kinase
MRVLVCDVGGTNVKLKVSDHHEERKVPSGTHLTAQHFVEVVTANTQDWQYDAITIGYPGPVVDSKILKDPVNLGPGWLDFDFGVLGKPFKIINDAAMQAVGSYQGGRMLFLGLGTGLGTTLILNGTIVPLEGGHLPYRKGRSFEDYIGAAGLTRMGKHKWVRHVHAVVAILKAAFIVDYVVLGGGNVKKMDTLPPDCRQGANENAFLGGVRLWHDLGQAAGT